MTARTEKRLKAIVELFKVAKPSDLEAVDNLGFAIKPIGDGLYRDVYRIEGIPLVIKIPKNAGGRKHARSEYRTVKRIKRCYRKYGRLRNYMPEIYYFDNRSGITVMHYYAPIHRRYKSALSGVLNNLVQLIWPLAMSTECDIHGANIGMDEHDRVKFIDLGYFTRDGGQEDW